MPFVAAECPVRSIETLRSRFATLSARQREIAELLLDGSTNLDVANHLGVTVHTVKAHRAEVMRRMEADSFADLVGQLQRVLSGRVIPSTKDADPLRILVVDDDMWYRNYLTRALREHRFTVVGVANGSAFEAAWAKHPADVVILDIELGEADRDGLSIAAMLRANHACGVIMVTARGATDDRLKGLGTGADAYFQKPVNIGELALTITNLGRRLS